MATVLLEFVAAFAATKGNGYKRLWRPGRPQMATSLWDFVVAWAATNGNVTLGFCGGLCSHKRMGRAKVAIKYINNEKVRKITFMNRKKGLTNKVSDFSTKSGAKACLIMYDGDGNVAPTIWPENPTLVNSMLQEYENQKIEASPKIFDIKNYFKIKKEIVEAEILKVKKAILRNKFPTWDPSFNNMQVEHLTAFMEAINAKVQDCNERINMMKNIQEIETNFLHNTSHMQNMVPESLDSSNSSQINVIQSIPQMEQYIHDPMELPLDDVYEMVNFTNHVDLPPNSSTNQLCQLVECDNLEVKPINVCQLVECDDLEVKPINERGNQFADVDDWTNQLDDDIWNWIRQPDQFSWNDISFLPPSEHESAMGSRGRDDKIIRVTCDADTFTSSMMNPPKMIQPTTSRKKRRMIIEDDDKGE
uniref:Uncharacterized protein LOC101495285 n=1 Tax=Cicer arietinum TaxID=3827 RepID=A0A1S2XIJ9_CICAR|nr:uncharacterized protein LOC101495285 [Cicer arietinum]